MGKGSRIFPTTFHNFRRTPNGFGSERRIFESSKHLYTNKLCLKFQNILKRVTKLPDLSKFSNNLALYFLLSEYNIYIHIIFKNLHIIYDYEKTGAHWLLRIFLPSVNSLNCCSMYNYCFVNSSCILHK